MAQHSPRSEDDDVQSVERDPKTTPEIEEQSFEDFALTRQEYITAIPHFYRGEVSRSNVWRLRVDATTNWAVGAAAATSGFAFSSPENTYLILIFGVFVVFALLWIEARRFRIYDVFRARVRRTEENFFGPILTRQLDSPQLNWGALMARDFLHPQFRMSFWEAMGLRLRRNYIVLFLLLLVCWLGKVAFLTVERPLESAGATLAGAPSGSPGGGEGTSIDDGAPSGGAGVGATTFVRNLRVGIGRMPVWLPVMVLASFYGFLLVLLVTTSHRRHSDHEAWGIGKEVETYDA